jgi:L-ascorbate metabolism protein UlaG (beta-lactamase superfamily)
LHRLVDRAFGVLLLALVVATVPACRFGRAGARTISALVSSPTDVGRNRYPVKPDARLAVLWVGHATALVQIDDKVILTDPVFTSSVGQLSQRLVAPGVYPDDLPPIDAVLISHVHYDHLSLGSLSKIESKIRALLMPRGGTAYLTDFGFPAYELATWQTWSRGGLRVTAAPVQHPGGRYGIDATWMTESATAYVVEYHGMKVYFGGDTAYDQARFVETGQRFPGIDVALLPIAPIEPRDIMRHFHMDPAEALQSLFDLGAARMVPIHYDTFVNSTDEPGDALRELSRAQKEMGKRYDIHLRQVVPVAIGERRIFLKPGQGPKLETPHEGGGEEREKPTAPKPSPPPAPTATSSSKIPDEDRFD